MITTYRRGTSFTSLGLVLLVFGSPTASRPVSAQPDPVWQRSRTSETPAIQNTSIKPTQAIEKSAAGPALSFPQPVAESNRTPDRSIHLDDLIQAALETNPRIGKATFAVEAAQGKRIQAGLYPNPVLSITGDELGDRTGPGGIWTAPQLSQEIVTGRKLSLSQAVAAREVDQAALNVLTERFSLIGSVRSAFYEVYALQRRAEILGELVKLAKQSVDIGKKLEDKIAKLDLIQLELELERVLADEEAIKRELPAAARRLAAIVGVNGMPIARLAGPYDRSVPAYDLEEARAIVVAAHPEVRSAKVSIEKSQIALQRARAEPIPNVSITSGYTRQNQNRSSDWMIGVSLPIPLWNRNQGNIRTAQADIGIAVQDVGRVENGLVERLASAFRTYAAARQRAERYQTGILPRAEETFRLSTEAFKGGQFEYLRVLQAQRALIDARLEFNRAIGEAWRAAGEISGMLLEETWPPRPIGMKK